MKDGINNAFWIFLSSEITVDFVVNNDVQIFNYHDQRHFNGPNILYTKTHYISRKATIGNGYKLLSIPECLLNVFYLILLSMDKLQK
jgi:hypothetical protein